MKRGFTLVELLAVITLLGLLSLIVVPVVDKLIKDSQEDLYNTQVNNIEIAAKNWASENVFALPESGYIDKTICELEDAGFLDVDIKNPKTDEVFYKNSYVRITKTDYGYEYKYVDDGSALTCEICVPVTAQTKTTGNIPQGNYEVGDEYICEVKQDTKYHFFILSKNENQINLIMDRNINSIGGFAAGATTGNIRSNDNVAWISQVDYEKANADGTACEYISCSDEGPLTAINFLNEATKDWKYVNHINELYNDHGIYYDDGTKGNSNYQNLQLNGYARLPKYQEIYDTDCDIYSEGLNSSFGSCPLWLSNYLHSNESVSGSGLVNLSGIYGYWLMDTRLGLNSDAWFVYYKGMLGSEGIDFDFEESYNYISRVNYGVRPVIAVTKSNIAD